VGYSTDYQGELKFAQPLTCNATEDLARMLGADRRDHPEWEVARDHRYWNYVDLELTADRSGLVWNGAEKTGDMIGIVNTLTREMRKSCPSFCLTGSMLAQGEEPGDVWRLEMRDGVAVKVTIQTDRDWRALVERLIGAGPAGEDAYCHWCENGLEFPHADDCCYLESCRALGREP
jgi:hypothetical protein